MTRSAYLTCLFSILCPVAMAQVEWNDIPLTVGTFHEGSAAYNQIETDIKVPSGVGLEYKIAMNTGDIAVYSWTSDIEDVELMDVEFHGHTEPVDGKGDLMFYKIHKEGRGSGTLQAPFTGIHGWYLNNRSDKDVVVKLKVSGFFEEVE